MCQHSGKFLHSKKTDPFGFWYAKWVADGCSGKEVRELKIAATERLINKYKVNLSAFMELNYNWATVASSANLASWFRHEEREVRSAAAHNQHETATRHQPGGTGMVCRYKFLQYARRPFHDIQELGRWCLWPLYCNPTHSTNCGGVSDRQRQVEWAAHNISTTASVRATPQHHRNSTATF